MQEHKPDTVGQRYQDETYRLLEEAKKEGITLRILGAQAIRIHCPRYSYLLDQMGREHVDIDFLALSEQRPQLKQFLAEMGYEIDRQMLIVAEGTRYIFRNLTDGLIVDVFIDCLDFCHRIDLRQRLHLDYPTIPLADLLLSKLQIMEIAEKDFQDASILMLEHEVSDRTAAEMIDSGYISTLLARQWGFYYTFHRNLNNLKSVLPRFKPIDAVCQGTIFKRVDTLIHRTQVEPKTLGWKLRSRLGTRIRWYKPVSSRGRVF